MNEPLQPKGLRRRTRLTLGLAGVVGAGTALTVGLASHSGKPSLPAAAPTANVRSVEAASTASTPASPDEAPPPVSLAPVTDAERIASARAGAKHSVPIQHPLIDVAPSAPSSDLQVQNFGSVATGQTFRVVSARTDLSGQDELGWVADAGQAVGPARCSQTFRFANQAKAARKANLLVCWQLSSTRSVYTVMVNLKGEPSRAKSVAAIAKQWAKLS